ncbi:reverse transcriptase domain-containing protein [Tanacetum coccineum]
MVKAVLLGNKEKLEEIAKYNSACSEWFAIIMNKSSRESSERSWKISSSICAYKTALGHIFDSYSNDTRAANVIHYSQPMVNKAEDVVVRVDGFTFLADFVVVNFKPDPRMPIILGRPFLRTTKALIDLYEQKLTLRVGSDELCSNLLMLSDVLPPSSSPVKTSDNLEEFADELTLLKKVVHEENFQVYSNPLFEFDDNFTSSNENPLFNEMDEDVENKNSKLQRLRCIRILSRYEEIVMSFLAMEVSSNFEEGYFDSEGDVIFLENLLSDDTTHNLAPEAISDHEPEQNNTSITFSPRSDPLYHEFRGEHITHP